MKRADMIKFIAIEFKYHWRGVTLAPDYIYEEGDWLPIKDAEEFLQKLEDLRMEPPSIWSLISVAEVSEVDVLKGVMNLKTGESWGLINKWEPEDEQS